MTSKKPTMASTELAAAHGCGEPVAFPPGAVRDDSPSPRSARMPSAAESLESRHLVSILGVTLFSGNLTTKRTARILN
jgi:hypothetical protein